MKPETNRNLFKVVQYGWVGIGCIVFLAVIIFAFWQKADSFNPKPVTTFNQGQEVFARHLELGIIYENNGQLSDAQKEYAQAAEASQVEIAAAAQTHLNHLLSRQGGLSSMQLSLKDFINWIVINLFYLILIVGAVSLLWVILTRLPRGEGYLLLPFEDFSKDQMGTNFHSLVYQTLLQAQQIRYTAQNEMMSDLNRFNIPLFNPQWNLAADVMSSLDTLNVGQMNLPLGKLIQTVRQWSSRKEYEIKGSLYQTGSTVILGAVMQRSQGGQVVMVWELIGDPAEKMDAQLNHLAHELAYRMLFYFSGEKPPTGSWRSLMCLMNGLQQIQLGIEDGKYDPEDLRKAVQNLTEAVKIDPGCAQAYFALGIANMNLGEYAAAQDAFEEASAWADPDSSLDMAADYNRALSFYHLFNEYGYKSAGNLLAKLENKINNLADKKQQNLLLALVYCGRALVEAQQIRPLESEIKIMGWEEMETAAAAYCEKALQLRTNHPDVVSMTSYVEGLLKMNHRDASKPIDENLKVSIRCFEKSLKNQPDFTEARIILAIAKFEAHQGREAIRILERIGELKLPGNPYAMFQLGKLYQRQDEIPSAKKAYNLAEAIPEAHIALGKLLVKEDRYQALDEFRKAVEINGKMAEAWQNIAWCIFHPDLLSPRLVGEAEQAAKMMVSFTAGKDLEWLARETIGMVNFYKFQKDQALQELNRSVSLEEHKQNLYHLAFVYFEYGLQNKAYEYVIKALQNTDHFGHWHDRCVALLNKIKETKKAEEAGAEEIKPTN